MHFFNENKQNKKICLFIYKKHINLHNEGIERSGSKIYKKENSKTLKTKKTAPPAGHASWAAKAADRAEPSKRGADFTNGDRSNKDGALYYLKVLSLENRKATAQLSTMEPRMISQKACGCPAKGMCFTFMP